MKCSLGALLILALAGKSEVPPIKAPPPVLPAIVYRDHVFMHYREPTFRRKPYVIVVRSLNYYSIRTTLEVSRGFGPQKNDFESLFVRGPVLVVGDNVIDHGMEIRSTDMIHYISADQLCNSRMVNVEPTGEPVEDEGALTNPPNIMWGRFTILTPAYASPAEDSPGDTKIAHTAMAGDGAQNLLVFDLLRIVPAKGKPSPIPKIGITHLVPEARRHPSGGGFVWGMPEEKKLGQIEARFDEPFQAYAIGDDYYFLTKSGSVYRSPPPEKGKPRTMTAIWDNKTQPRVRFIISDGNTTGVHFLIYFREKVGWEYFRLGPDPKPQLLATNPGVDDPPVEIVYDLALVLSQKKLIVTPPKKP